MNSQLSFFSNIGVRACVRKAKDTLLVVEVGDVELIKTFSAFYDIRVEACIKETGNMVLVVKDEDVVCNDVTPAPLVYGVSLVCGNPG